ncbi:restriction endonuclease subunit S [Shewanella xiamenensis]|uniref:restriction endonuclease subunit S n=1 Tax=Shewanella xiamenensis TaxID=332186 RepID=UPI001559C76B|nr:restriction endonuclease subunit S [Shewanella xiamenensis]
MSVEKLITNHIDIWTAAIQAKSASGRGSNKKLELYGIKKLRELILELAVRGKLVPQDPTDEPAEQLRMASIAAKDALIKAGQIKASRSKKDIKGEHFFTYPSTWATAKIEDLINVINGRAYKKTEMLAAGTPILRVGNLFTSNEWYYSDLILDDDKYIDNGDLIYAWSASFGPFIWDGGKVIYHYHIWKMDIYTDKALDKNFSKLYLQAISERIKASGNGIAMLHMTKERMEKVVHPLPPIEEQQRIVAKVDELMALCDQLEQQTDASIEAHQQLVTVLLDSLLLPPATAEGSILLPPATAEGSLPSSAADDFMANWARISDHFDTLFTTEASIDALKQTILQLAVMGKLVPQDPNDEPASALLERIAAEKARLVKEKKIKVQKALPQIADDEKPDFLPNGWECCRLDDICFGITSGSTPPKINFQEEPGIPYLKVYNIRNQKIDFEYSPQFIDVECHLSKLARSVLYPGDVVMNIVGPPLGKIAIIPDSYPEWNCNQAITFFRPILSALNAYIYTYLIAGTFLDSIELIGTAGQDNISVTKSRSIVLPTPPLAEQVRIVAKVDELMAICDQLKQRLSDSQQTQLKLTDALVDGALA